MTDDARLKSWASHDQASSLASEHIDVDTLSRHASGFLSIPIARVVTEHLAVCEDGRCVDYVRSLGAEVDATSGARYRDEVLAPPDVRGRTFQARDAMWATFEGMAHEQGVSVDEIVVTAMTTYARVRGYDLPLEPLAPKQPAPHDFEETHEAPSLSAIERAAAAPVPVDEEELARTVGHLPGTRPSLRPRTEVTESRTGAPPHTPAGGPLRRPVVVAPSGRKLPPPQVPSGRSLSSRSASVPAPASVPVSRPPSLPPRGAGAPSRVPESPRSGVPSSSRARELILSYRGQTVSVDKERFLIGRSKTQADLRLEDPNVSRQHAVIERVGSAWFLVDLGSTNGVLVAGERVLRRALTDGDVIVITTHEIQCALR